MNCNRLTARPYLYPLDGDPDLSDGAGGDGEEHGHGQPGNPVQVQGQEELLRGQHAAGQREGDEDGHEGHGHGDEEVAEVEGAVVVGLADHAHLPKKVDTFVSRLRIRNPCDLSFNRVG